MKMDNFDLDLQVTSVNSQPTLVDPNVISWESEVSTCWHCEAM